MKTLTLMTFAAALVATAALGTPAQARERHTTITGANGQTATRQVQRAGGDVQSSTTGPNGKTSSRTVDRNADGSTSATVTGPNGKTMTRNATHGGGQANSTVTGPNGRTASRTTTVTP